MISAPIFIVGFTLLLVSVVLEASVRNKTINQEIAVLAFVVALLACSLATAVIMTIR